MAREIDRRDPALNRTTPARSRSLNVRAAEISESLSGEHVLSITAFDAPPPIKPASGQRLPGSAWDPTLKRTERALVESSQISMFRLLHRTKNLLSSE